MNELGLMYMEGTYDTEIDYVKSIPLFRRAAEAGDDLALYNLAHAYRDGLGVEPDAVEATRLMIQSADKGYHAAQYEAALRLTLGLGIVEDRARAKKLFAEALATETFAADGYMRGQFNSVGPFTARRVFDFFDLYRAGLSTDKSDTADRVWHEQAYDFAQVFADPSIFSNLLLTAAEQQNDALIELRSELNDLGADLLEAEKRRVQFTLTRVAAEHGNRAAQADLVNAYETGEGTSINLEAALFWRQLSAAPVGNE